MKEAALKTMFSSASTEWTTPRVLFDPLNAQWKFTLDPAATAKNALCKKYYTIEENGLKQSWSGHRWFLNPPYGREIGDWVEKAFFERLGSIGVALLPARTDTRWFQKWIANQARVYFYLMGGRLKFGNQKNSAPFPSMLVYFV